MFIVDYSLDGIMPTDIDLIKKYNIASNSILITNMDLEIIGKEFYWRLYKFETKLKNNINLELTRCFDEDWFEKGFVKPDRSKVQLSLSEVDALEFYSQDKVQFSGIINDLSVEDEYHRSRGEKNKLSLGFWIKVIENWRNIECTFLIKDTFAERAIKELCKNLPDKMPLDKLIEEFELWSIYFNNTSASMKLLCSLSIDTKH